MKAAPSRDPVGCDSRLYLLALLLVGLIPTHAMAQDPARLGTLPPLDAVISHALANSPRVALRQALIHKNQALVDRGSKAWLDGFTFGLGSTYGSYGNHLLDEVNLGVVASVGFRISVFDVLSQKDHRRILEWDLKVSEESVRSAEMETNREIVDLYNRLGLAQETMTVQAAAWRSSQMHVEMAELEFGNGDIPVSELARVSEIQASQHRYYLAAASEYRSLYRQLELRIGGPLAALN